MSGSSLPDRCEGDDVAPREREVFYKAVDAIEIDCGSYKHDNGALRLYRRRGPWNLLRRQDVFHPPGEWWSVRLHKDGRCYVRLADPPRIARPVDLSVRLDHNPQG